VTLKERALAYLRQALNDPSAEFHEGQLEAIALVVERRARVLVVQRTGWGKSIVYFLATRLLRDGGAGPTLLISPLLALMRNQRDAAARLGVRARSFASDNRDEWDEVRARLLADEVDLLLISPERLANDQFRDNVLLPIAHRIGLLVVDEAHCISDWGHDFRPDYRRIARVLNSLPPGVPVITTTATANDRVVRDIVEQVGADLVVLRGPLGRRSLRLQVIRMPDQADRLAWLAKHVPNMPGSGIIYTLTTRDADRLASWLQCCGIDAAAYHAGIGAEQRIAREEDLLRNRLKVLVATTALGMGFDKPDLGFVVHFQRPGSVIAYYQQIGRAGRALPTAYAVLLGGEEDDEIIDYFIRTAFPPEGRAEEVLSLLEAAPDGLTVAQLEERVNWSRSEIEKVLTYLSVMSPAPVSRLKGVWVRNPVPYRPDRARVAAITALRRHEQARMQMFMAGDECLMAFLQRELDDPDPRPCGRCSVCVGRPLIPESFSKETAEAARRFLRSCAQPISPRTRWPRVVVRDPNRSSVIAPEFRIEEGRALADWGDGGWGTLVRRNKFVDGRFDERLVWAARDLIRDRWQPNPFPTWVTCIPSLRKPHLVPDFAQRLAEALGLPFFPAVEKIRETRPQKEMQNSVQQVRNILGAFRIIPWPGLAGPVLLVDDMVDSRWTFTVVGGLLRKHGSGPVYPLALADTSRM